MIWNEPFSENLVLKLLRRHHLSLSKRQIYASFYSGIPYLSEDIFSIANLIAHTLTHEKDFRQLPFIQDSDPISVPSSLRNPETLYQSNSSIIMHYDAEKKWRSAILSGDAAAAKQAYTEMSSNNLFYRTPQKPLRTQKNLMIVMNTICRIAAADAGADVVQIHHISEMFAQKIEDIQDSQDTLLIADNMLERYCMLVRNTQTSQYSMLTAKAIQYLYAYHENPLTLSDVARAIGCSEGHLSRSFKAETGLTVGQYLNQIRIREAISLLQSTDLSITEAAFSSGFASYAKFSIEFKKYTGMTASQYLQNRTSKAPLS